MLPDAGFEVPKTLEYALGRRTELLVRHMHGAEPGREPLVQGIVVEAEQRDVRRHAQADLAAAAINAVGNQIVAAEDRSRQGRAIQQLDRRGIARRHGEGRLMHAAILELDALRSQPIAEAFETLPTGGGS